MRNGVLCLYLVLVVLICGFGFATGEDAREVISGLQRLPDPSVQQVPLRPSHPRISGRIPLHVLPPPAIPESSGSRLEPLQIGVSRRLRSSVLQEGMWVREQDGTLVWALRIRTQGAVGVRLHFSRFQLRRGERVLVSGSQEDAAAEQYEGRGPFRNGRFVTGLLFGDTVTILYVPNHASETGRIPFRVEKLSHIFRNPVEASPDVLSCHLDASCDPAWAGVKDATARIIVEVGMGTAACSGTMLSNQTGDFTPFFLTASHCVGGTGGGDPATVQAFWFYQTDACNSGTLRPFFQSPPGADVIVVDDFSTGSDQTLLEILGTVPRNAAWAGWTTGSVAVSVPVTALSHPGGGIPPSLESFLRIAHGTTIDESDPRFHVVQFTGAQGLTEAGSSGCGLYRDSNQLLIGTLSFGLGTAACTGNPPEGYGKFSRFFTFVSPLLTGGGSDDALEDNDSRPAARSILSGSFPLTLKVLDEDWFSIQVPTGKRLLVQSDFTNANGNIDLEVFRGSDPTAAAVSNGTGDSETIDLVNGGASSAYVIHAFLADDTRNTYQMNVAVQDPDFSVQCDPISPAPAGENTSRTSLCTVTSLAAFDQTIAMSCSGTPPGVTCSMNPDSILVPAGGSNSSSLTLQISPGAAVGDTPITVSSSSVAETINTDVQLSVIAPFSVQCVPQHMDVAAGSSNTSTCTVTSVTFTGNVDLSCAGSLPCSMNPPSAPVSAGNSAESILTVSPDAAATAGDYPIQVDAASATFTTGTEVTATVSTALLFDEFNDNTLTWTVQKGLWQESVEFLSVSTTGTAQIFAPLPWFPSGAGGCMNCTHSVRLFPSGTPGRISILAWYVDKKNYVELMINDESNKIILKQKSIGELVAKTKALFAVDPGVNHLWEITFDGSSFHVHVDSAELISLPAGAAVGQGNVGFKVKRASVSFDSVVVQ